MNCEQCGTTLNRKKRFCSDPCRRLWWKEHPEQKKKYLLKCKECFTLFETHKKNAIFCSHPCRSRGNSRSHARILANEKKHITWGCGGGVDSTAIAILIIKGVIPKPDFAYMTDCGYEPHYVMDYVINVTKKELKKIGVNLEIINSAYYTTIDIINNHGVTIPAYTKDSNGETIKLKTRCSNGWKLTPAIKWLKDNGVKRMKNIVGIAVEERNRMKTPNVKWIEYDYPLVNMNLSRRDCKKIINEAGWKMPMRSSCVMCPQQTDNEWLDIKEYYPADFERAVMIERDMHKTEPNVYLHNSCVPLDKVKFVGGGNYNG